MKKTLINLLIAMPLVLPITSYANEVSLSITGQGKVENHINSCNSNCTLSTSNSSLNLQPVADEGWYFSGWQGQQCDWGEGIISSTEPTLIGSATGGAKTLESIDINHDGLIDLLAISLFNGSIISYINQGDGTFSQQNIITDLHYPSALDSYDWDNDGDLDLFIAEYGTGVGDILLYLNDGNGQFEFKETLKFKDARPYAFTVTDYDKDGMADIVVSSFSADISGDLFVLVNSISNEKISWYKNTGNELIEQNVISDKAAITIDSVEFDSIGTTIVSAEILSGEIVTYSAQGRAVISTGGAAYGAAFGDIDKDDLIDVFSAHYQPAKLGVTYGKENGEFSVESVIATPENGVTATAMGDFNNDSFIDLAYGEFNKKGFYYFATTSYKNCILEQGSSISIEAVFKKNNTNSGSGSVEGKSENNSSGGSVYWLSYLLVTLLIARKNK